MDSAQPLKNNADLPTNYTKGNQKLQECSDKYKEIIATLPSVDWFQNSNFLQYQDMLLYPFAVERVMSAQENVKAQTNDIVLCSLPKAGTTWLKAIAFAIVTRSKYLDSETPLLTKSIHATVPFVEADLWKSSANRDPDLPLLNTHITYTSLPTSIISSGCKIVYICRDVKDVIVSYYYFSKKLAAASNCDVGYDINQLYEKYCNGISIYGSYWDHVLGYWKASVEFPDKVLFLRYENIKNDPIFNVKKMAEFIGYPFDQEEENLGVVQKVVEMCSIETMSNLAANKGGVLPTDLGWAMTKDAFFRKGGVGDWKNHFTVEMAARLDHIIQEKFSPFGLSLDPCASQYD